MASQHNVKGIKVPRRGQKATKGKVSEVCIRFATVINL